MKKLLAILLLTFSVNSFAEVKEYIYSCMSSQTRDQALLKLKADPAAKDLSPSIGLEFSIYVGMNDASYREVNYKLNFSSATASSQSVRTGKTLIAYKKTIPHKVLKDATIDFSATFAILPDDARNPTVEYRYLSMNINFDDAQYECRLDRIN